MSLMRTSIHRRGQILLAKIFATAQRNLKPASATGINIIFLFLFWVPASAHADNTGLVG
jgi:hypothetical protein